MRQSSFKTVLEMGIIPTNVGSVSLTGDEQLGQSPTALNEKQRLPNANENKIAVLNGASRACLAPIERSSRAALTTRYAMDASFVYVPSWRAAYQRQEPRADARICSDAYRKACPYARFTRSGASRQENSYLNQHTGGDSTRRFARLIGLECSAFHSLPC